MKPYYEDSLITIYHGNCLDVLPTLEPVEVCITDPPYGLEFMGKDWDKLGADVVEDPASVGGFQDGSGGNALSRSRIRYGKSAASMQEWYRQHFAAVLDALLPGAMCLAFGGTRTFHRLTSAIEDAGFEIRDCMMWLYGSGFPKSMDVSKAIDAAAGAEREVLGTYDSHRPNRAAHENGKYSGELHTHGKITAPTTDEARQWHGWGTALKPAWEPIVLAMKPLEGTFAANALTHGVAGLNIDGARIAHDEPNTCASRYASGLNEKTQAGETGIGYAKKNYGKYAEENSRRAESGRWPANLVLDEEAAAMLDEAVPDAGGGIVKPYKRASHDYYSGSWPDSFGGGHDSGGGASRFFYTSKASRADRGPGNDHPTVKPSDLMKWLVKLTATPTGGTILDPFMGSGTTLYAAKEMGRKAIGIELEERYCEIAASRLAQGVLPL